MLTTLGGDFLELLRIAFAEPELLLGIYLINGGNLCIRRIVALFIQVGPLLYALDQIHILCDDPDIIVVDKPTRVTVPVVLVASQKIVMHLSLVILSFNLASIVEDMNPTKHIRCTVVAISAQVITGFKQTILFFAFTGEIEWLFQVS